MNTRIDGTSLKQQEEHYEAALKAAFENLAAVRTRIKNVDAALPDDPARELQLLDLIRALAATLGDLRRIDQTVPQPKVSDVHSAIEHTLQRTNQTKWTSAEIRSALAKQGIGAPAKTVTNCIDYMVRTKRLHRLARGLYFDPASGVGISTSSELSTFQIPRGSENED